MKRVTCLLALLVLTACSPQSVMAAWHWRDFTAHPAAARYAVLKTDLAGCAAPGCDALKDVNEGMIDALTADISVKNAVALQAGMRVYPL